MSSSFGDIEVDEEDRLRGTYIIGSNGTGKSTLISGLIQDEISNGYGVCLLDPHGTIVDSLLGTLSPRDLDRTILLDLTDQDIVFGLNLFDCSDPDQASDWVEATLHVFNKVWGLGGVKVTGWGATLEDLLRNISHTLIANPGMTMAEIPLLLRNAEVRRKLVANVTNQPVKYFWEYDYDPLTPRQQREDSDSTLNKVRSFLTYPQLHSIVGSSHTTIDFTEVLDSGQILLVKFDPRRDDMTTLIGTTIVSQLLYAAYSRGNRDIYFLYADEFQKFATEDFATIFAELRKFGVAVTVAHQFREQLDEQNKNAVLNAGNLVVFRVSGADAEELAPEFSHTPEPERLERIEEEIIEGEEEIKSVSQTPIDFILHHSHENALIRRVRETLLSPLKHAVEGVDKEGYWLNRGKGYPYGFGATREQLLEGLSLLNELLVSCMEEQTEFSPAKMLTDVADIVAEFRGFIGFASGIESKKYSTGYGLHFYLQATDFTRDDWDDLFAKVKLYYSLHTPWASTPLERTLSDLFSLCGVLQNEPILVSTGQFKPRKHTQVHYIQHPQRQYSDTKNQTAEELAKQSNFTAHAKLTGAEQTIEISFAPSDTADSQRILQLKEMLLQRGILRRRSDVEAEIVQRQRNLLATEEKPEEPQKAPPNEGTNEQKGSRRKREIKPENKPEL